jgi:hypothetical protein
MSASKRKGTAWETAITKYLRDNGAPHAERRTLNGTKDRGDITGIPGVVIEAKNTNRIDLADWISETETERRNDNAEIGACWIKRRGHTNPGAGYVLMTGDRFLRLLYEAGYVTTPPVTDTTTPGQETTDA